MLQFITDTAHYTNVLDLAMKAKKTLWIGTADIKDLYVLQGRSEKPFLGVLAEMPLYMKNGGPSGTRTPDRPVMSRLL